MRALAFLLLFACATQASSQAVTTKPVALLSWQRVTMNEDGSPLKDLAGYVVYQGPSPLLMTPVGKTDKNRPVYVLAGLLPGTYYFVVTAVNSRGIESVRSSSVWLSVRAPGAPGAGSGTPGVPAAAPASANCRCRSAGP